jgi:predicted nucleotidyltransferase component of viral defense system
MLSIDEIRKLAIIALFSDDDLMDTLVLKGGNALTFAYNVSNRASIDVDVSIPADFSDDLSITKRKLDDAFTRTFGDKGHQVFDTALEPKPTTLATALLSFWGGYEYSFKIIAHEKYTRLKSDPEKLRKQATAVREDNKRTFTIDISKYEYCDSKEPFELDGFTIYVYPPLIIIYEKLRALCQQIDAYVQIVPTMRRRPRARDFFDIYSLLENPTTTVDLCVSEHLPLLHAVFNAKKVPLSFLRHLGAGREFHRQGFSAMRDTVSPSVKLETFDFYFDYVMAQIARIIAQGVEKE